jgi:hypothetical protein
MLVYTIYLIFYLEAIYFFVKFIIICSFFLVGQKAQK